MAYQMLIFSGITVDYFEVVLEIIKDQGFTFFQSYSGSVVYLVKQNLCEAELGEKSGEIAQFCHNIPDLYRKFMRLLWMFSELTMEKLKIPTLRWNSQAH